MTFASSRLVCADVHAAELAPDGVSAALKTRSTSLIAIDTPTEVGLWRAGVGQDNDVEVDEVFLVLSGEGTVTFEDDSTIVLRPGVLVHVRDGDRTRWRVDQPLRKLYLAQA